MVTNIFPGILKKVQKFDLLAEVVVSVSQSFEVVSVITSDSFDYLNAHNGCKISCLIKPTDVMLGKPMCCQRVSAPNCFLAKVVEINSIGIGVEILAEIPDGNFIKALTVQEQVDFLDLKKMIQCVFFLKNLA